MLKVEEGIAAYFASVKDTEGNTSAPLSIRPSANRDVEGASGTQVETLEMPFAKVNSVTEGSPAAKAGLKAGDKVCNFGNITWANHENLTKIAAVVTNNIEVCLPRTQSTTSVLLTFFVLLAPYPGQGNKIKLRWRKYTAHSAAHSQQ